MNKNGTLREAMEEEDELYRAAIKSAAYEYESHGDPRRLQAHLDELAEGSKARQRELFRRYNNGKT